MGKKWIYIVLTICLVGGMVVAMFYKNKWGVDLENTSGQHHYGVSADHPEAARIGMEVLEEGGNAVDAAIAISYALGVTEPFASGIGGSGLMVVHPNQRGKDPVVFNYREEAPASGPIPAKGVGIPGLVRGMELAHKKFGTVAMKELIQPSITLCEDGVEARDVLTRRLEGAAYRLNASQLPHIFPNGKPIQPGERFIQTDLASTLKKIVSDGSSSFYNGKIATDIIRASHGLSARDLTAYKALQMNPIKANIGEYEMISVPAPGGGSMLIQFLQMAEALKKKDPTSSESIQTLGAIRDQVDEIRKKYLGDPRFVDVPIEMITSKKFLAPYIERVRSGDIVSEQLDEESSTEKEDDNTTHFVVVDRNGMMVSCTNTLGNFFGSGIVVNGFFLNDGLSKFSASPHSPNRFQRGKRPVTFTAPTIFTKEGQPVLGIGASGGSRIPFMLAEVLISHLFHDQPLQEAITQPRYFVKNNIVFVENELSGSMKAELERAGYYVEQKPAGVFYGGVQAIRVDPKTKNLEGGYDFRREATFKGND